MNYRHGFTLIELMVTVAIIAILSSIGIPSYQKYIKKAAVTDMLQATVPYKMAVELCVLEQGDLTKCNAGSQGVPTGESTRYIKSITVVKGVITLVGDKTLTGLTVVMTATKNSNGRLNWNGVCTSADLSISESCKSLFGFTDVGDG
ncbi:MULTISPECIES: prepilin peptidase-dependent pilin [Candidatus Williamhamiltonella]|uniref:Prepilin peptidase-dependent pilin n=1 Tax=Candidatus Williamhamiltonella defendens TaxID=138072 RepID=A0A2D3TDX3_9ENTR|nr:prepilin peptidase-dependent pilin [Candidatus Hamiltonella defensa]ATW33968.1 prepilin peptidase-dependent pilin [Candidatus Hamiltonella defensa]AYB48780.1 prepilin peptidase-dependent pilin [Candidatus Hamiltonella defensa]